MALPFWLHCNEVDYAVGMSAIAQLGLGTFDLVDSMLDDGVAFDVQKQGLICAARSAVEARSALHKLEAMRAYGYQLPDDVVGAEDLHELEPTLTPIVRAGFLIEQHWHVRADEIVRAIAAALRERGATTVEGAKVVDFVRQGDRIKALRTAVAEYSADEVVLATGSWTTKVAALLDVRIPVQAGKGYSFTVYPRVVPRHAVLLTDLHVGCSPYGHALRIAGTMEFSGLNVRIDQRRIDVMLRGVRESFGGWSTLEIEHVWAGLRPVTPDGLPVIDRVRPYRNLFVAAGHSMQGVTLGPATGRALATYIMRGERPTILEPFAIERFTGIPLPRRRPGKRSAR